MRIIDVEQGSPEWFAYKAGVPSASNFDKLVTTKGEPSKSREQYILKCAGEKVTGVIVEGYKNQWMEEGQTKEEEARAMYELVKGMTVEQVGFCVTDYGYGCSPDGMILEDGLLEIKCPLIHTHVKYLLDGCLPSEYFHQVQGQLLVTNRKWCDFVSYFPGLKPLIVRVFPDKEFHAKLHAELLRAVKEISEIVERIK